MIEHYGLYKNESQRAFRPGNMVKKKSEICSFMFVLCQTKFGEQ